MTFKLTILGSSSALPTVKKYPSAHVLNVCGQIFLIDAGEGVQVQLRRYGFNLLKLNHIFITHLHGDHVYGVFGLLSSMNLMGRTGVLHIYAPSPIEAIIENHIRFFEPNLQYPIECHQVNPTAVETIFETKALEVITIPLRHRVPTCGYLFREKLPPLNVKKYLIEKHRLGIAQVVAAKRGEDLLLSDGERLLNSELTYLPYQPRSFAYCSDTSASGKVRELVRGVDLLYHEATFLDADKKTALQTGHTTAKQAATLARDAAVRRLVIGHFSSRYGGDDSCFLDEARSVFDSTDLAVEGKEFDVPPKGVKRF